MSASVVSLNNLGRCPYCIRKSFHLAIVGWVGTTVSLWLLSGHAMVAAAILTLLPTMLWVAHLGGYVMNASNSGGKNSKIHSLSDALKLSAQIPSDQTPCPAGCPPGQTCCVRTDFNNHVVASGCCVNCYDQNNCVF